MAFHSSTGVPACTHAHTVARTQMWPALCIRSVTGRRLVMCGSIAEPTVSKVFLSLGTVYGKKSLIIRLAFCCSASCCRIAFVFHCMCDIVDSSPPMKSPMTVMSSANLRTDWCLCTGGRGERTQVLMVHYNHFFLCLISFPPTSKHSSRHAQFPFVSSPSNFYY